MSNCKARLMKPTGLEFHDTAFEIDKEIWNFIKHELKRKTKSQEGNLPVRYWQTHAVPLHDQCWALIESITNAMSVYPTDEFSLNVQRGYLQEAIGHNESLLQIIRLIYNELPEVNIDKLSRAVELITLESKLLRGAMAKAKIRGSNA